MNTRRRRAVFLDRDGVLNRALVKEGQPYPPLAVEEVEILPGVARAIKKLKDAEFLIICVTNQPDVARGTQQRQIVEAIHRYLLNLLSLDEIMVCYHDDPDQCQCRKPLPGMLWEAANKFLIDLNKSIMVGDRWRDIEAGQRAGCATVLIDNHYPEKEGTQPDVRFSSLLEAVDWILSYNKLGD
ncbi:MAG: HAD family hydrolase [Elusimicrobia bacterium]|nr:HAD family hydrolase [Elusimicrobiota bacterium]